MEINIVVSISPIVPKMLISVILISLKVNILYSCEHNSKITIKSMKMMK
jgi:hypothetical protein